MYGADLVFFCRPFLNALGSNIVREAFDYAAKNELAEFRQFQEETKRNRHPWHIDNRFLYNLMNICADYGEVHTHLFTITQRIVDYTRKNQVLAMIQQDTAFLLFDANYQYWSLMDLDIVKFTTKSYCRITLYRLLDLTTQESQLLAGISRLCGKAQANYWKFYKIPGGSPTDNRLPKMAHYVKKLEIGENDWRTEHLERVVHDIHGKMNNVHLKALEKELSRYNTKYKIEFERDDQYSYDFVKFCNEKLYFAYGLLMEVIHNDVSSIQALAYIDLEREDSKGYIDLAVKMLLKQCGVLFKDYPSEAQPQTRLVQYERKIIQKGATIETINVVEKEEAIIYPPSKFFH